MNVTKVLATAITVASLFWLCASVVLYRDMRQEIKAYKPCLVPTELVGECNTLEVSPRIKKDHWLVENYIACSEGSAITYRGKGKLIVIRDVLAQAEVTTQDRDAETEAGRKHKPTPRSEKCLARIPKEVTPTPVVISLLDTSKPHDYPQMLINGTNRDYFVWPHVLSTQSEAYGMARSLHEEYKKKGYVSFAVQSDKQNDGKLGFVAIFYKN